MKYPEKGLVVDGSTRGNPGPSEYQIYDLETKQIIFKSGWLEEPTTNNICEFLALCTGIYLSTKRGGITVYSDSQTAISWVKKHGVNSKSDSLSERIKKALLFIQTVRKIKVEKWHTAVWGENPADFGRKSNIL